MHDCVVGLAGCIAWLCRLVHVEQKQETRKKVSCCWGTHTHARSVQCSMRTLYTILLSSNDTYATNDDTIVTHYTTTWYALLRAAEPYCIFPTLLHHVVLACMVGKHTKIQGTKKLLTLESENVCLSTNYGCSN